MKWSCFVYVWIVVFVCMLEKVNVICYKERLLFVIIRFVDFYWGMFVRDFYVIL